MSGHHGHSHGSSATNRTRLAIALAIIGVIFVVGLVGALVTGSLALLVDAAHSLTDSVGLLVALIAATLMARPASDQRTWGWKRMEVLAACAQAIFLLGICGFAVYEGIQRLVDPPEIAPDGLLIIGAIALLGNIVALMVLAGGRGANLNMRAAFLEVAADALGSLAVIAAAVVIALTGWVRADAVAALLVAALIIPRALVLLRASASILLESTPSGLDLNAVRTHMLNEPHVVDVHDLHASTVASGLPILTAHVVLEESCFSDEHSLEILESLQQCMTDHHDVRVEHCTFQLETAEFADAHKEHLHA